MVASQPAGRPNNRHEPCDVAVGVTVHAGYKVGGGSGGGGNGGGYCRYTLGYSVLRPLGTQTAAAGYTD